MSYVTHPKNPDEITREWMSYALSESGPCEYGSVRGIKVEPLGPHLKGLLSAICRVRIEWDKPNTELPDSVVVKFPPVVEERRKFGNNLRVFERELLFYRELAGRSPVRIPKCYFTVLDEANEDYLLVLEDACDWVPGDQINGLTYDQTISAVKAISKLHGYWWDSGELQILNWMPEENRDSVRAFKDNWEDFSAEHRAALTDKDIAAGAVIAESGRRIHDLSLISPRTVIHYDFRADNMMFNEADEILILDWQVALRSFGAFDVTRAVCGSHHGILESEHHLEFVNVWHEGLRDSGVRNYSLEDAWCDYRLGLILLAYVPVAAHHFLSHEGTHGILLLRAMIERIFYAIHECEVLEILR